MCNANKIAIMHWNLAEGCQTLREIWAGWYKLTVIGEGGEENNLPLGEGKSHSVRFYSIDKMMPSKKIFFIEKNKQTSV